MRVDEFISRLTKVRRTAKNSWLACCPAHDDKNPSMTVSEGSDGRILVHCFSHECSITDIAEAVGLKVSDLMPENVGFHRLKPMKMAVNPKDALCAVKTDMTVALVIAKDMQKGIVPDEQTSLLLGKLIGRIQMAIDLSGGE
ncbi:MAG TPA: CHC2 zinc finger domain-containing protein [Methanosarcina sp.]|nr:CHC2 zinc finger domain-containing protein [Methanosarcina sp.]